MIPERREISKMSPVIGPACHCSFQTMAQGGETQVQQYSWVEETQLWIWGGQGGWNLKDGVPVKRQRHRKEKATERTVHLPAPLEPLTECWLVHAWAKATQEGVRERVVNLRIGPSRTITRVHTWLGRVCVPISQRGTLIIYMHQVGTQKGIFCLSTIEKLALV